MPGNPLATTMELPENARETADALIQHRMMRLRVGADRLVLAAHWVDLHPGTDPAEAPSSAGRPGGMRSRRSGADGTPEVGEDASAELGVLLGIHPHAASSLMTDAVNLRHRHPHLWARVIAGEVEDWVATKTARLAAAGDLDINQARWVDAATYALAPGLGGLAPSRYLTVLEARIVAANPEAAEHRRRVHEADRFVRFTQSTSVPELGGACVKTMVARANAGDLIYLDAMVDRIADILATHHGDLDTQDVRRSKALGILANPARAIQLLADAAQPTAADEATADEPAVAQVAQVLREAPAALRPPATLYFHIAPGSDVARAEGIGPVTLAQVREWIGHCHVRIVPVIDLADITPVDAYESPARVGEAVRLLFPHEAFPWATRTSRGADLDHTSPYRHEDPGQSGEAGQTGLGNLAPLHRRHHRIKTHAPGWRMTQPRPGVVRWRTPTGHWVTVDHNGTRSHHDDSPGERRLRDLLADWGS